VTPQEVLLAAAGLLERDGWCQGAESDHAGHRCARQAIRDMCDKNDWYSRYLAVKLVEVLVTDSVERWNDTPLQTSENVIATLRIAAE
jgi:hypothetical protein